jgi:hypothetical protein
MSKAQARSASRQDGYMSIHSGLVYMAIARACVVHSTAAGMQMSACSKQNRAGKASHRYSSSS